MKYLISYFSIVSFALGATGDLIIKQKTASGSFRDVTVPVTNSTLIGFDGSGNIGKVNNIPAFDVGTLNITGNVLPLPPGTISMWATADIANKPTNTLVCDGTYGTPSITAPTNASAIVVKNATLGAPSVTPASGTYTGNQTITATGDLGSTIYYTTNATNPDHSSSVYSSPLTASTTTEYRFAQVKNPGLLSPVTTRSYVINTNTYIMDEGFEESDTGGADGSSTDGYDSAFASTETVTGTGATIAPDATDMAGRVGSQSIKIVDATTGNIVKTFDLGSNQANLWIKLKLTTSGIYSINRAIVILADSGGNDRFTFGVSSTGITARMVINGTGTNSTVALVNGTAQYVWIKYQSGAACGIYVSTTDALPSSDGSGTVFVEGTGAAYSIRYIRIGASFSQAITYWFDDIKVSTTAFP